MFLYKHTCVQNNDIFHKNFYLVEAILLLWVGCQVVKQKGASISWRKTLTNREWFHIPHLWYRSLLPGSPWPWSPALATPCHTSSPLSRKTFEIHFFRGNFSNTHQLCPLANEQTNLFTAIIHSAAEQSFLPIEQGRFCRFHPSDPTQPWPQSPACCINWYLVKYQTIFTILSNRDYSLESLSCVACSLSPWSCRNASLSSTTLGTSWMPEKRSFLSIFWYFITPSTEGKSSWDPPA